MATKKCRRVAANTKVITYRDFSPVVMAVAEGFEPSDGFAVTRFRGVLLRPLGHATAEQLTQPGATHPNRWRAKNASSGAAHSRSSTPPRTCGR
jgi:hypothetical protein